MRQATFIAGADRAADEAVRRVLEAAGASFDPDPASLLRTGAALRGAGAPEPDPAADLFARVVSGFLLEGVTIGVEWLDCTVIHPLRDGEERRTAEFAFAYAARTAKRNIASFGAMCDIARQVAGDYPAIMISEPDDFGAMIGEANESIEITLADRATGQKLTAQLLSIMGSSVTPSLRRGSRAAMFEPAEDGAYALLFAGAMLLELLGEGPVGDRVAKAAKAALASGVAPDADAPAIADAVLKGLKR